MTPADAAARDAFARRRTAGSVARRRRRRTRARADAGCPARARRRCASAASRSMPRHAIAMRSSAIARLGQRAGLVEQHVRRRGEVLERVGTHDEHAAAARAPRARASPPPAPPARTRTGTRRRAPRRSPRTRATDRRAPSRSPCRPRAPARARRSPPPRARRRARAAAARSPRASVSATMPATTVSAPTRVTRSVAGAPTTMLPAHSASPRRLATGADSPQSSASSTRHCVAFEHAVGGNAAAVGDDARDRRARARTRRRAAAIRRPRTRSANTGVSRASASDRSPARWRARISR